MMKDDLLHYVSANKKAKGRSKADHVYWAVTEEVST